MMVAGLDTHLSVPTPHKDKHNLQGELKGEVSQEKFTASTGSYVRITRNTFF